MEASFESCRTVSGGPGDKSVEKEELIGQVYWIPFWDSVEMDVAKRKPRKSCA
jgi:hypothetical protein